MAESSNSNLIARKFKTLTFTLLNIFVGYFLLKKYYNYLKKKIISKKWKTIASFIRKERDDKINKFLQEHKNEISEDKIQKIIQSDLSTLCKMLRNNEISSKDLVVTFSIRSGTIGKNLGLICDIDFEGAYEEAIKADESIKSTKNIHDLPPLIGIPICIKEHVAVNGMLSTCGFVKLYNNIPNYDSYVVSVLRKKGAIPFVKGNIPPGNMAIESLNGIWGFSKNPWDLTKTVGGSSGGNAGLLAAKCTPLAFGSDIAGSIRIPSNYNGVYGFKPSSNRISRNGSISYTGTKYSGFLAISSSWGPMCLSAEDLIFLSKILFGEFSEDLNVNTKKFDDELFNVNVKSLKIGFIIENEFIETAPAIKYMMNDVCDKLSKDGYILEELKMPTIKKMTDYGMIIFANSQIYENLLSTFQGEEIPMIYKQIISDRQLSNFLFYLKRKLFYDKRYSELLDKTKKISLEEYIETLIEFQKCKNDFLNYLTSNKIEAIICPVFPVPACEHLDSTYFIYFNYFNLMFNCTDMPSCAIPITLCEDISYESKIDDSLSRKFKNLMSKSKGMPLGIQIGTCPQKDELALRLMKEIDSYYRFDLRYSKEILSKNFN